MICQQCGEENNVRHEFCTGCGANLKVLPPSPAIVVSEGNSQSGALRNLDLAESLVGETLDRKYHLNAVIGVGTAGAAVYNATRLKIGDEVAIKILNPEPISAAENSKSTDLFMRKAQIAARFKHPNAVSIFDFDVSEKNLLYLVMELAAGQSLRQIIKQQGATLPLQTVSAVAEQVADALDEAHRQGIIHGDIKSDNIIVNAAPHRLRVKVLDFGLAKLNSFGIGDSTPPGVMTGTTSPRYMSPEQCLGEEIDGRSDIYSLGIVLYEMLTGRTPFDSLNPTAIAVQHVTKPPAPLISLNPDVLPTVEAVVMRSLQKQREERQQTAAALAQELHNAVYGASSGASRTYFSGEFSSPLQPPANPSASENFTTAESIPVTNATPVSDRQENTAPPLPPAANLRGETIAPPLFASSMSYPERKANSGRRLLIAGAVILLLLIFGSALIWRQMRGSGDGQTGGNQNIQSQNEANSIIKSAPGINASGDSLSSKSSAEGEFRQLQSEPENAAALKRNLKEAENKFPDDYRFTYRRAKIEAVANRSHHAAFELLFKSGTKAIKAGKSADLLSDLQKDKNSDLKRLTDHKEWTVLENALQKNDSKALEGSSGH